MNFSTMIPEKIYSKKYLEIMNMNTKGSKKNLILFIGYDRSQFTDFINSDNFLLDYYKQIYTPHKFKVSITNTYKRPIIIDTNKYTEYVKSDLMYDFTPIFRSNQLKGINTIYDLTSIYAQYTTYHSNYPLFHYSNFFKILEDYVFSDPNIINNYTSVYILTPMDVPNNMYNNGVKMLTNLNNIKQSTMNFPKKILSSLNLKKGYPLNIILLSSLYMDNEPMTQQITSIMKKAYNTFNMTYIYYSKNGESLRINNSIFNKKQTLLRLRTMYKVANNDIGTLNKDEIAERTLIRSSEHIFKTITNKKEDDNKKSEIDDGIKELRQRLTKINFNDMKHNLNNYFIGFSATGVVNDISNDIKSKIDSLEKDGVNEEDISNIINNDEFIKNKLRNAIHINSVGKLTEVQHKLHKKALDNFKKIKFDISEKESMTFEDILKKNDKQTIDINKIEKPNLLNNDLKKSTITDFDKNYNRKMLKSDIIRMFAAMTDDFEKPLVIHSIKKEDTSNELNFKETYTVKYRDIKNQLLTVKVDLPIFVDDKYILLNGAKKIISKQIFSLPVTKTNADEVFVNTVYKKINVIKVGKKPSPTIERLFKFIDTNETLIKCKVIGTKGYAESNNLKFLSNVEYLYMSTKYTELKIGSLVIDFNLSNLTEILNKTTFYTKVVDNNTYFPIGIDTVNNSIFFIDIRDNNVYGYKNGKIVNTKLGLLYMFIIDMIDTQCSNKIDTISEISKIPVGKSYAYSAANIMARKIPLIVVLSASSSLSEVLDKAGVEYTLSDKKPILKGEDKLNKRIISFKDFHLIYNAEPAIELLMNGLYPIDTRQYNFEDVSSNNIMFDDYFDDQFRLRRLGVNINRMLRYMIDPITSDVIFNLNDSNNIIDLLLMANGLLTNKKFNRKNNMSLYRIKPSGEIIVNHLYHALIDQYRKYLNLGSSKYSLAQNVVLKSLLEDKLIENFSIINPIFETQATNKASWRGIGGINMMRAYQMNIRKYDKSMVGILGTTTPDDANVGAVRFLSYDSKISNLRGMLNIDPSKKTSGNLFTPAELANSFNSSHSDPSRQAMATKHSEHLVPTKYSDKPVIGTGIEKTLPYITGRDFTYVAKENGEVIDVDDNVKLITIKYKSGAEDVIDYSMKVDKNSASGIFLTNQLKHNLKKGDKFKKDDILAKNDKFFKESKTEGVQFTFGPLAKVAMVSQDLTLEDASIMTQEMADKLMTEITMEAIVEVDDKTNIIEMVKIGDHVDVGDPLVVFERVFDDTNVINMLAKLSDEMSNDLNEYAYDVKRSKYNGEIVDIRIYYNKEISEFTPKVQKIIKNYISRINKKANKIKKINFVEKPNIIIPRTEKYKTSKIITKEIDGLLIKIFIKHDDPFTVGDKVAFHSAIKSINSKIISNDKKPYSEFRKDEPIDAMYSQLSVISRMTTDIFNLMYTQKILIELKRKAKKMWEKK